MSDIFLDSFQATPWTAAITNKAQDVMVQMKSVDQLKTRAVKAKEELAWVQRELERVSGQATGLANDKQQLEEDNGVLRCRVDRQNAALKLTRKQKRKVDKLLALTEERCYQMGYDDTVIKAHGLGWQHKRLLDDGMDDPVGQTEVDAPVTVSSGEDEEMSS